MEAIAYRGFLQKAGWDVAVEAQDGGRAVRAIRSDPPQAVLIYLTRLPSHGRQTASHLRSQASIQNIPIVFVGGKKDVVKKTQEEIPGAIYTPQAQLESILDDVLVH
jgi:DNA-binding response OmpR family regulator